MPVNVTLNSTQKEIIMPFPRTSQGTYEDKWVKFWDDLSLLGKKYEV